MFEEGCGQHQNKNVDIEELARQEVRTTKVNCVDSHAVYIPPVCVYFNFKITEC